MSCKNCNNTVHPLNNLFFKFNFIFYIGNIVLLRYICGNFEYSVCTLCMMKNENSALPNLHVEQKDPQ